MSRDADTVRFAFAIADGPNEGLTSGRWRVWVHHETIYVAPSDLSGKWKASLHGDDAWRVAVTKEHHRAPDAVWAEEDRAPWKFDPTPFVEGRRLAFVVAVTRGAFKRLPIKSKDSVIEVEDRWDRLPMAKVIVSEPRLPPVEDSGVRVGRELALSSGRSVQVVAAAEAIAATDPEPEPASTVIEVWHPRTHDVAAPGFFLRGVNVG